MKNILSELATKLIVSINDEGLQIITIKSKIKHTTDEPSKRILINSIFMAKRKLIESFNEALKEFGIINEDDKLVLINTNNKIIKNPIGSDYPRTLEESIHQIKLEIDCINVQLQNADSNEHRRLSGLIRDEKIKILKLYETVSKSLGILNSEDRIILVEKEKSIKYDKIFELRNQILNLRCEIDSMDYNPIFKDNDKKVLSEVTNRHISEKIEELLSIYEESFKEEQIIGKQDRLVLVENDMKSNENINTFFIGECNPKQEEIINGLHELQHENERLFQKARDIYLDMERILNGVDNRLSSFYNYCSVMMWFNLIMWFVVLLTLIFKN